MVRSAHGKNRTTEFFFGMVEGLTMYDVMLWLIRLSVPLLIARVYFKGNSSDHTCGKPANRVTSAKQHFTISSDRPLFEIRESRELNGLKNETDRNASFPSVSRECLLGLYVKSLHGKSTNALFGVNCALDRSVDASAQVKPSPEQEKLYLQSLVQFRALRSSGLNHATWERWNEEAQRILNGASLLGCSGVPAEVYDTMMMAGVLPDSDTFLVLVQTAMTLGDLAAARNFLTEMSNAGFLPPRHLVDEVSRSLNQSVTQRLSLNKYAPEFIPSLGKIKPGSDVDSVVVRE